MTMKKTGHSGYRLACLGLTTVLTVSLLCGCGGDEMTQHAKPDDEHGKQVSKNQENFMKTNPYKGKAGAENVQTK